MVRLPRAAAVLLAVSCAALSIARDAFSGGCDDRVLYGSVFGVAVREEGAPDAVRAFLDSELAVAFEPQTVAALSIQLTCARRLHFVRSDADSPTAIVLERAIDEKAWERVEESPTFGLRRWLVASGVLLPPPAAVGGGDDSSAEAPPASALQQQGGVGFCTEVVVNEDHAGRLSLVRHTWATTAAPVQVQVATPPAAAAVPVEETAVAPNAAREALASAGARVEETLTLAAVHVKQALASGGVQEALASASLRAKEALATASVQVEEALASVAAAADAEAAAAAAVAAAAAAAANSTAIAHPAASRWTSFVAHHYGRGEAAASSCSAVVRGWDTAEATGNNRAAAAHAASGQSRGVPLRVMSYNVWNTNPPRWLWGDPRDRFRQYAFRMHAVGEVMRGGGGERPPPPPQPSQPSSAAHADVPPLQQPDIIALQEVRYDTGLGGQDPGARLAPAALAAIPLQQLYNMHPWTAAVRIGSFWYNKTREIGGMAQYHERNAHKWSAVVDALRVVVAGGDAAGQCASATVQADGTSGGAKCSTEGSGYSVLLGAHPLEGHHHHHAGSNSTGEEFVSSDTSVASMGVARAVVAAIKRRAAFLAGGDAAVAPVDAPAPPPSPYATGAARKHTPPLHRIERALLQHPHSQMAHLAGHLPGYQYVSVQGQLYFDEGEWMRAVPPGHLPHEPLDAAVSDPAATYTGAGDAPPPAPFVQQRRLVRVTPDRAATIAHRRVIDEEGPAIFSRFPIVASDYLLLSRDASDEGDGHQRVCLHAVVDVTAAMPAGARPGGPPLPLLVDVYTVHLALSERARNRTAAELLAFMKASAQGQLQVLQGDMNAEPHEPAMRCLVQATSEVGADTAGGSDADFGAFCADMQQRAAALAVELGAATDGGSAAPPPLTSLSPLVDTWTTAHDPHVPAAADAAADPAIAAAPSSSSSVGAHPFEPPPRDTNAALRRYAFTFPSDDPRKRIDLVYASGAGGRVVCDGLGRSAAGNGNSSSTSSSSGASGSLSPSSSSCIHVLRSYLLGQDPLPGTEMNEGKGAGMVGQRSPIYASDHRAVVTDFLL